jgi:hypothetical protein
MNGIVPDNTGLDLDLRIEALRTSWAGYQNGLRTRFRRYLDAFSPPFESRINGGEHDQWPDAFDQKDEGRTRSSFNLIRAGVELWTSLEASEFPTLRFGEEFIPTPAPDRNEEVQARRQETYRATKLVRRQVATMREQAILRHVRRSRLPRHWWTFTRKKNIYGRSWMRVLPDTARRTFQIKTAIDPATVFPVWQDADDRALDAILVATRRSARVCAAQWPGSVSLSKDGITAESDGYYNPTRDRSSDKDRAWVWVEDYWMVDPDYVEVGDYDGRPYRVESRVINATRVNERLVKVDVYPGWRRVPYFSLVNEDEREEGFSDVGTMLPVQDGLNRMLSQQQDVIFAESRPRFKYRGDADREIVLNADEVVSLDPDEDIDQIQVSLDVFPTQTHGQQLLAIFQRMTGLPAVVWGEIQAAQNSGRALSTAWRATAARMVPRINGASTTLDELTGFMLDTLELYDWDDARELFGGTRDFEWNFPNKEPRDFLEVIQGAINKLNAGLTDSIGAMEEMGVQSPDELLERIRSEYMDMVLHPDKGQAMLMLQRLKNQIEIEAQQAGMAAAQAMAQLAPGPTPDQQAGAVAQQGTQAAQRAAPTVGEGQNSPATQAGAPANATQKAGMEVGTLVQDGGPAMNRIITKAKV